MAEYDIPYVKIQIVEKYLIQTKGRDRDVTSVTILTVGIKEQEKEKDMITKRPREEG